jgi:hypothetical protein
MPIFNVIKINQTQLSKVMVARQRLPVPTDNFQVSISDFHRWRNYIRKEVKKTGNLPTTIILN